VLDSTILSAVPVVSVSYVTAVEMARLRVISVTLLTAALFTLALPVSTSGAKPRVVATIGSLAGVLKDAFGDVVEVVTLLPAKADPHLAQLTPDMIEMLDSADLIVCTGHLPIEERITHRYAGKTLSLQDFLRYGVMLHPFPNSSTLNPHAYWLLPENAVRIAECVATALAERTLLPKEVLQAHVRVFDECVQELVQSLREELREAGLEGGVVVATTGAEMYVVEGLGFEVAAILTWESHVLSNGKQLLQLHELFSNKRVVAVTVSDTHTGSAVYRYAQQLASDYGIALVKLTVVAEQSYSILLKQNAESFLNSSVRETSGEAVYLAGTLAIPGLAYLIARKWRAWR